MQLDSVLEHAVQLFISSAKGLTKDTLQLLCQITWPVCMSSLVPVFSTAGVSSDNLHRVLLTMLGNLEAVWAMEKLSSMLLKLPLTAVHLLLASDQLQVHSEDTVMYTVAQYVTAQPKEQQQEVSKRLSQLVRAPQLSDFQLAAQAANEDETAFNVLQPYKLMLQSL
eukprot:GHUV01051181.1.p1 GENE.GHUV01051181.1~~GHUV01051181.1.p1  ORF type:complete len:167 (+),score=45.45 GHUV01051181.1:2-502(+)